MNFTKASGVLLGLLFSLHLVAHGAERFAPEWGSIAEPPNELGVGRFMFHVERRPADGRLPVPTGFPQIIRAAIVGEPQPVVVELNADASAVALLLPKAPAEAAPVTVAVETADETTQFADGRIVFTARDARVLPRNPATGSRVSAKLESHPANHRIGFWTNPEDTVNWTGKATRWGMYDVVLTYSTAAADGTEIECDVGDTTLKSRLASTGSWYRYTSLPLGRVYLATAGEHPLSVRCTKKMGGAVMNLKSVTLSPACEGTPPVQAADGSVILHGRDATVLGTALRYEPAENKQTLGFWGRPTDAARWEFTLNQPGTFDVEVLQGCGTGQGGSTMAITIDEARSAGTAAIEFVVEDTGGFQAFRPRIVGRVSLATAGRHDLRIAPTKIAKAAACDVRQIRLVPVKP